MAQNSRKDRKTLDRRDFLASSLGAGLSGGLWLAGCQSLSGGNGLRRAPAAGPKLKGGKPNIVLILADDLGYGDLSGLNAESKIHTANMDRMAAEGMVFTDGHAASSVCTPSRYSILLGRYCWRGRLQRSVLWPYHRPLMEQDRMTLPEYLKGQGYSTACIGKWHLGWDWPFKTDRDPNIYRWQHAEEISKESFEVDYRKPIGGGPTARGFDYYFGDGVPNFPPYCWIENDRTVGIPNLPKPDSMFGAPGAMVEGWDQEAIMPTLTEKAVKYIREQARGEEPFFLYFSLTAPHTPIVPTAQFKGKSGAGVYGDFVLQVDDTVGRINAVLQELGIEEETLVIMTSDNGSPARDGSWADPGTVVKSHGHEPSWILRGMKADTWDGGHRIPLIVKWPGKVEAASQCDELVCLMDIMATCAAIMGKELPAGAGPDSLNILPYLLGQKVTEPIRRELVHHGIVGMFGLRQGDWKLIMGRGSGGFTPDEIQSDYDPLGQLYNLKKDIREEHNLYWQRPDMVRKLMRRLTDYRTAERARVSMD